MRLQETKTIVIHQAAIHSIYFQDTHILLAISFKFQWNHIKMQHICILNQFQSRDFGYPLKMPLLRMDVYGLFRDLINTDYTIGTSAFLVLCVSSCTLASIHSCRFQFDSKSEFEFRWPVDLWQIDAIIFPRSVCGVSSQKRITCNYPWPSHTSKWIESLAEQPICVHISHYGNRRRQILKGKLATIAGGRKVYRTLLNE